MIREHRLMNEISEVKYTERTLNSRVQNKGISNGKNSSRKFNIFKCSTVICFFTDFSISSLCISYILVLYIRYFLIFSFFVIFTFWFFLILLFKKVDIIISRTKGFNAVFCGKRFSLFCHRH